MTTLIVRVDRLSVLDVSGDSVVAEGDPVCTADSLPYAFGPPQGTEPDQLIS
ncbi:hypothetical protein ACFQY4_37240 [Catellatospora bangladeshensis]|uniref:hypothetical protein n=1 Tax=Catellatospora bangladeshensis TaxID=310355 RepID=UPI001944B2A4|nr:hypothetical protein [Catellatospora bangladeshensis]